MMPRRMLTCFLALALIAAPAAAADLPKSVPVVPAKYGLDDMTDESLDELAKLIDALAQVETVFMLCTEKKHYDRQLRAKIEGCIEDESIQRVQFFFDERVDTYLQSFDAQQCTNPEFVSNIPELEEQMESALWQVGLMCSLCILC